jgi:hypothetical protein
LSKLVGNFLRKICILLHFNLSAFKKYYINSITTKRMQTGLSGRFKNRLLYKLLSMTA